MLPEQLLLEMRLKLEELISEREGMIAENYQRHHLEQSMAYVEDSFLLNAEQIKAIRNELLELGAK